MTNNRIEIKTNIKRLIFYISFYLIIMFMGIIIFLDGVQTDLPLIYVRILGMGNILYSIISLFFMFYHILRKDKGLVISEKGILDNSSFIRLGLIEWQDITRIKKINDVFKANKFLLIYTENPEKYSQLTKSKLANYIINSNYKYYKTPIKISPLSLKCNINELEETVRTAYEKYQVDSKNTIV